MYKFEIVCLSYENGSFRFRQEFLASDLTGFETSSITCSLYNTCMVRGIPKATLCVKITDNQKGYRSHITGEKMLTIYENILALLESAVNEHLAVM